MQSNDCRTMLSIRFIFLSVFLLVSALFVPPYSQAAQPWETPQGQACFERWISDAMSRLNAYNGNAEFNARKPWSINRYGILEGNPRYGPTSVAAPDNFGQYGSNKYWYMWDYWHAPGLVWRYPEWNAAGVPHIRNYVLQCIGDAGVVAPPPPGGDKRALCDQYARTAVSQNEDNLRRRCGYTGSRWQSNYDPHFNWCMGVDKGASDSETRIRDEDLRKCGSGGGAGSAFVGCFKDASTRDLSGVMWGDNGMTVGKCINYCSQKGYAYAGVQYGSQCFCGNSYGKYGKSDNCNYKCAGNKQEICGGFWANSIYAVSGGVVPPPPGDDKRAMCDQYARTAVSQNEDNLRRRCGYTGSRWQSNYDPHFNWCMGVDKGASDSETRIRDEDLRKCGSGGTTQNMEGDTDRRGSDYSNFNLPRPDPGLCQEACMKDARCKAWTYVKPNTVQGPNPRCWLKNGVPSPQRNTCCVSGVK